MECFRVCTTSKDLDAFNFPPELDTKENQWAHLETQLREHAPSLCAVFLDAFMRKGMKKEKEEAKVRRRKRSATSDAESTAKKQRKTPVDKRAEVSLMHFMQFLGSVFRMEDPGRTPLSKTQSMMDIEHGSGGIDVKLRSVRCQTMSSSWRDRVSVNAAAVRKLPSLKPGQMAGVSFDDMNQPDDAQPAADRFMMGLNAQLPVVCKWSPPARH